MSGLVLVLMGITGGGVLLDQTKGKESKMKLYILHYMDIMTGHTGYIKVRADSEEQAVEHVESKYEDYEVIMDDWG